MAGETRGTAVGIVAVFGTSSFTAELKDMDWGSITRESKSVSHQGTAAPGAGKYGNMEFIPGDLTDPGTVTLEMHFDPDTEPPIDQPAEVLTITWPKAAADSTAATWSGTVFCIDYSESSKLDEVQVMTVQFKVTGNVTLVAAA